MLERLRHHASYAALAVTALALTACRTHEVHHEREVRIIERGGHEVERHETQAHHRGPDGDGRGEREPNRERQAVEHQTEALRVAMHGLMEMEKPDWAERVEHGIHARELRLEGRRDREAIEIMESAPDAPQLLELVVVSKRFWAEHGHEDKVEMLEELEGQLRRQWERSKGHEGRRGERGDARPHERELQEQVRRQGRALEEMSGALREMRERLQHLAERLERMEQERK